MIVSFSDHIRVISAAVTISEVRCVYALPEHGKNRREIDGYLMKSSSRLTLSLRSSRRLLFWLEAAEASDVLAAINVPACGHPTRFGSIRVRLMAQRRLSRSVYGAAGWERAISDATRLFREYILKVHADPELKCPHFCTRIRIDNAGEWGAGYDEWQQCCIDLGIEVLKTS